MYEQRVRREGLCGLFQAPSRHGIHARPVSADPAFRRGDGSFCVPFVVTRACCAAARLAAVLLAAGAAN